MAAQILEPTPQSFATIVEALRHGDVVGMPTETVYGLAANIWNEQGILKVFGVKERPTFDPLIVHLALSRTPLDELGKLAAFDELSPRELAIVETLIARFWPGPLTLVLPKKALVSDLITSGLKTVAVRMPAHPVAQALLAHTGFPLAAPSANRFGRISPTTAQAVATELGEKIAWILEGGPCEKGLESSVVGFAPAGPILLRPGSVASEDIEAAIGQSLLKPEAQGQFGSPGFLLSHYAPRKPLHSWGAQVREAGLAVMLPYGDPESVKMPHAQKVVSLSVNGDDAEAARNLFAILRSLDEDREISKILWFPVEKTGGLWPAILDRLQRATHKPVGDF